MKKSEKLKASDFSNWPKNFLCPLIHKTQNVNVGASILHVKLNQLCHLTCFLGYCLELKSHMSQSKEKKSDVHTRYVIDNDGNRRISNVRRNQTAKSLLSCCIPQLQSYLLIKTFAISCTSKIK